MSDIGRQQQSLPVLVAALARRDKEGASKGELSESLALIAAFTARHFSAEEAYMAELGYPKLDTHRLIHRDLLAHLHAHLQTYENGGPRLGHKLRSFFTFWLLPHIQSIDWQVHHQATRLPDEATATSRGPSDVAADDGNRR